MLADDRNAATRAEELVALLVEMYGDGLRRVVERLDESTLRSLTGDPAVAALLVLHELHPDDAMTRVNAALDKVRPYLGSHAGGVEFLGIDGSGVARLRLQGSCDGCPASAVTVKMAIEGAILESAPEVVAVEVEGVTDARAPEPTPVLLQIGEKPAPKTEPRWVTLEGPVPDPGLMEIRSLGSFEILLAATEEHTYAYRDDCPGCGAAMISGTLDGTSLSCPQCGRSYDLARAGRSVSDDLLLNPIPFLVEDGVSKVAIPEVVG